MFNGITYRRTFTIKMSNNSDYNSSKPFEWKDILIIVLLILAVILTIFRIRRAQKSLTDYLKTKRQILQELLSDIEKAQKDKQRLLLYKSIANVCIRILIVGALFWINFEYLSYYLTESTLPEILGSITDFNAILLLIIAVFVFLRYGSFLELKNMYDAVQNSVLHWFFNKKMEAIDTLLQSNLANRNSILREIEETENAIKENEDLLYSTEKHSGLINIEVDSL